MPDAEGEESREESVTRCEIPNTRIPHPESDTYHLKPDTYLAPHHHP